MASIPSVPAGELRTLFDYTEPFFFKPHTGQLTEARMELDDIQVLRYLFRNARPRRHLEFGTWEGRGALACLEECDATVWTINLLDGERAKDGSTAYGRVYRSDSDQRVDGDYTLEGVDAATGGMIRSYRTDSFGFIGRYVRDAGLSHRVCQIFADSRDWDVTAYPQDFFDSVLVDGGHDPDTVVNDTRKALSRLRPGGLILWHDFCPEPEVFNDRDSSCHGVISGLAAIWPEVEAQLTEFRWIEGSWLLVGMRAGEPEVAPRLRKGARSAKPAAASPRSQTAMLASGVASLQRELDALAKFREERDALNDEMLRVRSENASLSKRVAGYAALVHERDLLLDQNDALRAQGREREALAAELSEVRSRLADLELERDALSDELNSGRHSNASSQQKIADLEAQLAASAAERDRLDAELAARTDRIARLEAEEHEYQAEMLALQEQFSDISSTVAERERQIESLKTNIAQLTREIADRSSELDSQRQALLGHNRENESQAEEIAALKEAQRVLEDGKAALQQENAQMSARLERAKQDFETALDQRADEIARLQESLTGSADEIVRLNEAAAGSAAAVEALRSQLADRTNDLDRLQQTIAQNDATIASLEDAVARSETERSELQAKIAQREDEIEALRQAVASSEADTEASRAEIARLQQSRSGLALELEAQKKELARVATEQEHQAEALADAQARAATLVDQRDRVTGRLVQVERALRAAETDRDAVRAELNALSAERTEMTRDIDRMNALLAHFERVTSDIRRENENLRAVIDDYATSESWRLTAPLRMVSGLFRR